MIKKVDQIKTIDNRLFRGILIILGSIFLGFGIIGIIIPLLPTTPFLLLAAACYARSSKKLYNWLLNNKWFGSYITNYLEGQGIPIKIKLFAISTIWVTILFSVFFIVKNLLVKIILIIIATVVSIYLISIKTKKIYH